MRGKNINYDFLNCARKMPPLRHITSETFDITQSEVARWLVSQPDIMQKIFDMAANHKMISYHQTTRTWRGADNND